MFPQVKCKLTFFKCKRNNFCPVQLLWSKYSVNSNFKETPYQGSSFYSPKTSLSLLSCPSGPMSAVGYDSSRDRGEDLYSGCCPLDFDILWRRDCCGLIQWLCARSCQVTFYPTSHLDHHAGANRMEIRFFVSNLWSWDAWNVWLLHTRQLYQAKSFQPFCVSPSFIKVIRRGFFCMTWTDHMFIFQDTVFKFAALWMLNIVGKCSIWMFSWFF